MEIGKLPEKEFRIMILQMIKNLENKMEKMQVPINKDLGALKNKHTNSTVTGIKTRRNLQLRIGSRRMSRELEGKMLEITSEELNQVNRMKRTEVMRIVSGAVSNAATFEL